MNSGFSPLDKFTETILRDRRERDSRVKRSRKRKLIVTIVLTLVIALGVLYKATNLFTPIPTAINSFSTGDNWSMYLRNATRSNSAMTDFKIPKGNITWAFTAKNSINTSIVSANGLIYFGSNDGNLYAIDKRTGQLKWRFQTGSWVLSSPATRDDTIFFGSNDGHFYALNALSGKELWRFDASYAVVSSPAIAGNRVFFGGGDYSVYALDRKTGSVVWRFNTGSRILSSPVVANGRVYVGSKDGYLYCLHSNNGRLLLKYKVGSAIIGSPAVSDTIIYISGSKGRFFALDGLDRNWYLEEKIRPRWAVLYLHGDLPIGPPTTSGFLWDKWLFSSAYTSPVISGDNVLVTTDAGLVAINSTDKTMKWRFLSKNQLKSSPAVAGNWAIVTDISGNLIFLDKTDGQKVWELSLGGSILTSPTVADDAVYVGTQTGKVYAIE